MTHLKIERIDTTRLDIDLKQPITMSFGVVRSINVILVRMRDQDGLEGLGEATVLGGPFWGGESAEAVQATIESYLKPLLLGTKVQGIGAISQTLTRFVRGNAAARNAVETAALDLIGQRAGRSASEILGGAVRSTIPVAWTLSTGSAEGDIEEGERAYAEQGHRRFKLKIRRSSSDEDVARSIRIIEAFRGRAAVIADVNQGWDEVAANRYLPMLQEAGLEGIEQPLPAGDIDAAARLSQRYGIEIIADEALTGPDSAFRIAAKRAATSFGLKPNRDGGPTATQAIAAIAAASGLGIYGGTMLETSLGTIASAHLYATIDELRLGSELFGPLRIVEDIASEPFKLVDGELIVPSGPGLGFSLDEDRVAFIARKANE